jgi:hypothetical protein
MATEFNDIVLASEEEAVGDGGPILSNPIAPVADEAMLMRKKSC